MYKDFYGFSAEPFALSPDPQFLYLAGSHFEALSSMIAGIKERKGITVITGEVGIGKTILIYSLLKDLDEKMKIAFIFQSRLDLRDLLKTILLDLEVPIPENGGDVLDLLLQFRKYLNARLAHDETVTILIDEAQNLETEVLKDLGRLCEEGTPSARLLQIVLVGQPELEAKLNSEELEEIKKRVSVHRRITPLTREEGRGYIAHRLKVAGREVSEVFTPEAVNRIWEFAGGIPRVMNLVCDRALLIGFTNSRPRIDSKIAGQAIKDLHYLGIPKPKTSRRARSRVKSPYKVLGILLLLILFAGLGLFSFLSKNFKIFPPKNTGKTLPFEKHPAKETREEILKAPERTVPSEEKPVAATGKGKIIEVKRGWNLSLMARQYYTVVNLSLLDFILDANPQISDLNLIFPRQKIKLPDITEESLLIRISDNNYRIRLGTFPTAPDLRRYEREPSVKGKTLEVLPRKVSPGETWYRVEAGGFTTREEALNSSRILQQRGLSPLLECLPKK